MRFAIIPACILFCVLHVSSLLAQQSTFDAYSSAGIEAFNTKKDFASAKRMFKLAVEAGAASPGANSLVVHEARLNLALSQMRLKEYQDAADNVIFVYKALTSPTTIEERNMVVRAARLMGEVFSNQSRAKECQAILEWAIAVERQGRNSESDIIGLNLWLEDAKLEQKDYAGAKKLVEEIIEYRTRTLGPADLGTRWAIDEIARIETLAGNHEAAESYYSRLLQVEEDRVPPDRSRIAALLKKQTDTLKQQKKWDLAVKTAVRSKEIFESGGKSSAEDALGAAVRLANLHFDQKAYAEGDAVLVASLKKYEDLLGKSDRKLVELIQWQGWSANTQTKLDDAANAYLRAVEILRVAIPLDRPGLCYPLTQLAIIEGKRKRPDQAEKIWREVIEIRKEQDLDSDLANAVARLADLYQSQGDALGAEKLLVETLAEREQKYGLKSPKLVVFLNSLAGLYSAQGKYDMAEKLLLRSLENREDSLGKMHLDVAESLEDLGDFYEHTSRYSESESMYRRGLVIREQLAGGSSELTAKSLKNVSWELQRLDRLLDAEPLARKAVAIWEAKGDTKSQSYGGAANALGCILKNLKKYGEAEKYLQAALAINEAANNLPNVATQLNNLGLIYVELGRFSEAQKAWERAIPIQEQELQKESITATDKLHRVTSLVRSLSNLASLKTSVGELNDSSALYEKALRIAEKDLEPTHELISTILVGLSGIKQSFGAMAEAEALLNKRGEFIAKKHGLSSQEMGNHRAHLANLRSRQGKYHEAKALLEECRATVEEKVIRDGGDISWLYLDLADVCNDLSQLNDAEQLARKAIETSQRVGGDNSDLVSRLGLLASIQMRQGKVAEAERLVDQTVELVRQHYGAATSPYGFPLSHLASLRAMQGKWDEVKKLRLELLAIDDELYGPGSYAGAIERRLIAKSHLELKEFDLAKAELNRSIDDLTRISGADHFHTAYSRLVLAEVALAQAQPEEAKSSCSAALEVIRATFGVQSYETMEAQLLAARIEAALKSDGAESSAAEVVKNLQSLFGVDHWQTAQAQFYLGQIRVSIGKLKEAEEPLRSALKLRTSVLPKEHPDLRESVDAVAALLENTDRATEAKALRDSFAN